MKIAYIAAGAGGMYCGSCIHDNALVTALQARGEEALLLPLYTPLRTDEPSAAGKRIFYGAINIYLEQKLPWFRYLPTFFHRWLDRPQILKRISASSSATDAKDLGALTLSMLQGEEGRQARELAELVAWLKTSFQPDVVHLAYSMLLGLAPALQRELGVPVLCSVQGEEIFLEDLDSTYKERVLSVLRQRARDIEHFVATSQEYARFMTSYLEIPPEKMSVARIGINLQGHRDAKEAIPLKTAEGPLTLGFMARICPEKGLHTLCEAFRLLAKKMGAGAVRLRVAGYLGGRDRLYFEDLRRRLEEWGLAKHFEYIGEVDRDEKIRFLQSLDLLSVPTTYHEAKGLYILEALANGVPVVQPRHGAFPELVEQTGGGILVRPGSVEDLVRGILELWHDPEKRRQLGTRGRESVHQHYSAEAMAQETLEIYERVLGKSR